VLLGQICGWRRVLWECCRQCIAARASGKENFCCWRCVRGSGGASCKRRIRGATSAAWADLWVALRSLGMLQAVQCGPGEWYRRFLPLAMCARQDGGSGGASSQRRIRGATSAAWADLWVALRSLGMLQAVQCGPAEWYRRLLPLAMCARQRRRQLSATDPRCNQCCLGRSVGGPAFSGNAAGCAMRPGRVV
jgi:hypothetical protein